MARERAAAARLALTNSFASTAVSDAYYAMLYATQAALSEEDRYAKTHRGLWSSFGEIFVATGRFERELYRRARRTQELREAVDYSAERVQPEKAESVVELAERFVEGVAAMFDE